MAQAGGWKRTGRTFKDVSAVLARYPGLARLRPGRVTYFELADQAAISAQDLVAVLDPCAEEGSDTPGEWSDSCGWEDYPVWEQASRDLALLKRLASVNDMQFSWLDHDKELIPLIADEDRLVAHDEIAATHLAFTGYSFVGWSAGNDLVLVRSGLACSAPTGDALTEGGDDGFFLMDYPDQGTTKERSSVIADWLLRLNFAFYAALNLEPLDPAGTLDEDARGEWESSVPTEFESSVWVPEDVTSALRAELTRRSECYRYTAAARANPTGREAQVLHASGPITVYEQHWYGPLEEEPDE